MALVKGNARSSSALDATVLTGNLPAISGASLTGVSAGKVLQVVQASDSTELSTTSNSLQDTGLSVSITPSNSSNKVLIIVDAQGQTGANVGWGNAIIRGSTNIFQTNTYSNYGGDAQQNTRSSYCYLDSPSTTSATTYKLQVHCYNAGTILQNESSNPTTMTLMEIEA